MIPLLKILSDFRLYTGKDILPPTHTINSSRTGHLFVLESAPITSVLGPLFTVPSARRAPPLGLPWVLFLVTQLLVQMPPLQEAFSDHALATALPSPWTFSYFFTFCFFTVFVTS